MPDEFTLVCPARADGANAAWCGGSVTRSARNSSTSLRRASRGRWRPALDRYRAPAFCLSMILSDLPTPRSIRLPIGRRQGFAQADRFPLFAIMLRSAVRHCRRTDCPKRRSERIAERIRRGRRRVLPCAAELRGAARRRLALAREPAARAFWAAFLFAVSPPRVALRRLRANGGDLFGSGPPIGGSAATAGGARRLRCGRLGERCGHHDRPNRHRLGERRRRDDRRNRHRLQRLGNSRFTGGGSGVSMIGIVRASLLAGGGARPRWARSACSEPARISCATRNAATSPNEIISSPMATTKAAKTARISGNMRTAPALGTPRCAVAPASNHDDPSREYLSRRA